MTEKTLLVTLRLKLADLPDEKRKQFAKEMEVGVEDLATLENEVPEAIAERVADAISSESQDDYIWAGSDTYVTINDAEVISAVWEE